MLITSDRIPCLSPCVQMMCEKMLEPSSVTFLYSFTELGTPWSKIIKWNMRQLLAESISQAWWNVKPFSIPPFTISLSRDSTERDKRSGGEKLLVYKKTDNHPFWMNINCASSFLNNRLGCVFLFLRKKYTHWIRTTTTTPIEFFSAS